MRIGVDIDDVIYPFWGVAHSVSTRAGITNGNYPSTWTPWVDYGCSPSDWYHTLADAVEDGTLHSADPLPGAASALYRLRNAGHTVHLVTARGEIFKYLLSLSQTVKWLNDHQIPYDTLTFAADKTLVNVDVFADDHEKNIAELHAAGVPCVLIDAPHNQHVDHRRATDIAHFVDMVLEGEFW